MQALSGPAARNALPVLTALIENVRIFSGRSERRSGFRGSLAANPRLAIAVVTCQGAHLATMYLPGVPQEVLGTRPIDLQPRLCVEAIALSLIVAAEVYNWVRAPKLETAGRT